METKTQELENKSQETFLFKIDVVRLLGVCKNLKDLVTEVRLNLNRNGLRITEIDPANVCRIDVFVNKFLFQDITENEEIQIYGINIESLYKILKEQKKELVHVIQKEDKLIFAFTNGFKSELNLILIEGNDKPIPSLDFKTRVELTSKRFKEIIKNCASVADNIVIEKKDDEVFFISKGTLNKTEIKLNTDETRLEGENSKSRYSLDYLEKFVNELMSDKVTLKFATDFPLVVEYITENFKLSYLLAPRVQEDD